MTLIKTSLLNGIAVVVKMLTLLGINKILAIYVGPSGYAAIGQFQNAVQMITTFASGAVNTGVVKYTAEYADDESAQHKVWQTAGAIALAGTFIASVCIALFSVDLANLFLNNESFSGVFLWFSATLVLFTLNTLLLSILNGKKEIAKYVLANISGSLFSLVVTTVLVFKFGLYGALVSLAVYQSLTFATTFFLCIKSKWFKLEYLVGRIDKAVALNLAKYTAMALTTALSVPMSHILIRNYLSVQFGLEAAGYWEALWRLSSAYLMVVTTTLGVYYLPRLSELKTYHEIRQEILQGYKIILPVAALCGLLIYMLRDLIIILLFTRDFAPMRELFAWQMIGDTLKIGSWILAYMMLGKAMFKAFIASEIVFSLTFYLLTVYLTGWFGFVGVSWAHAINYGFYFIVMYFMVFRRLHKII
ncbi:O-antigen translocase [Pseudomonas sp. P1.8]|uniref:O-antigen translocase n=2 Tax=unclassified Pseudomonas TaxID=196821 RepID=UPI00069E0729|nr:O-antigen translocase [Pseudomonas sp. P1.8]